MPEYAADRFAAERAATVTWAPCEAGRRSSRRRARPEHGTGPAATIDGKKAAIPGATAQRFQQPLRREIGRSMPTPPWAEYPGCIGLWR